MKNMKIWITVLAAHLFLSAMTAFGYATNRTWVVVAAAPDKNWSQVTNWSQNTLPTAADQATFPRATDNGRQTVTVDGDRTISDLVVSSSTWQGFWTFDNPSATLTVTNDAYLAFSQIGNT